MNKRKLKKAQKKIMDAQLIIAGVQGKSEWWQVARLNRLVEDCMDLVVDLDEAIRKF